MKTKELSAVGTDEALDIALQWLQLFRSYAPVIAPSAVMSVRLQNWQRLADVLASDELAAAIDTVAG